MKIPVYNCEIEDSVDDATGIYAISFVDLPANEVDFVALDKNTPVLLNKNPKKQILTGVLLKPEQMIYRYSEQMGEYYIKFSAEQIQKIAHKMMKTSVALHNTTHLHQSPLSGNYLTELWIVEDPRNDKSNALGFHDLPKGTLMCSYKIEDRNYWDNEVMTGNVKGFSLEGFFNQEINMSKITHTKSETMKKQKINFSPMQRGALLSAGLTRQRLSEIESSDKPTSDEENIEFILKDGKTVVVDPTGYATMDGEQMAAGEHALADGNTLVIDEKGYYVETKQASSKSKKPAQATPAESLQRRRKLAAKDKEAESNKKAANDKNKKPASDEIESKIAEMQTTIDALTQALEEALKTVEDVKKVADDLQGKTPSALPATPKGNDKDMTQMSVSERMAVALSQRIRRR